MLHSLLDCLRVSSMCCFVNDTVLIFIILIYCIRANNYLFFYSAYAIMFALANLEGTNQ